MKKITQFWLAESSTIKPKQCKFVLSVQICIITAQISIITISAGKQYVQLLINTKYVIFNPMTSYSFQFALLNSFQFHLLSQADIKAIIKRNWKESKKQIENNLTSLGENYFRFITYFPKIFLDSIIFRWCRWFS